MGSTKLPDSSTNGGDDINENGPESMLIRLQANQKRPVNDVDDEKERSVSPIKSADNLYDELNESDIAEIYLGRSETENAVAELEKSTANEVRYCANEDEHITTQFSCDSGSDRFNTDSQIMSPYDTSSVNEAARTVDSAEGNGVQIKEDSDIDSGKAVGVSQKRSCDSPTLEPETKRMKVEANEIVQYEEIDSSYSNVNNTSEYIKIEPLNNNHNIFERGHERGIHFANDALTGKPTSAIETTTPVAIVTPLSSKKDFLSEPLPEKGVSNKEKEIENLKSDISAILESFAEEENDELKNNGPVDKHPDDSSSIKLTDKEFEKFKSDLFSEQTFKTMDGVNWNFSLPQNQVNRRNSVQNEIGDFEKVLNNYMNRSSEKEPAHRGFFACSVSPKPKPLKGYRKDIDPNDPSVILSNSELLRELLDDKPDKNTNKANNKRPAHVDLSFLKTDMLVSKCSVPVSSVLKTKTIEPIAMSPALSESETIVIPDEKRVDHGPLSLAEQRRASVTLHHKVPSLSDLVSATGPLNKMDGDETEAILNEITGATTPNGFDTFRRDFTSPLAHDGIPDVMNGMQRNDRKFSMVQSTGVPQSGKVEFNGRFPVESGHVPNVGSFNNPHEQQRYMKMGNMPQMMRPSSVPDYWSVDFENMPPERRQILTARYGHLMRNKREFVDPMQNPMNQQHPPQIQRQHSIPVSNNSMFPNQHDPTKAFMSQSQKPHNFNANEFKNNTNLNPTSNLADSKLNTASSANGGPGAMNDRMRHLMMQQLHRRRMMAQMQNQQGNSSEQMQKPVSVGSPNDPLRQMPYSGPGQPMRTPSQNIGQSQGHPYSDRQDMLAAQYNQQPSQHPGARMYPGKPPGIYQRQMSQPNSMAPLVSPTQQSMMRSSSPNSVPFQFERNHMHQTHYQEMPQHHRQMQSFNMQGQTPNQNQYNRNQHYLHQNVAYNGQMSQMPTNNFRNMGQGQTQVHPGMPSGNDIIDNGVQSKDKQAFGHQGVDFF